MNMKWILLAISVVIFVGPIGSALVIHRDNLAALVVPEAPEFMTATPKIEYVGYEIIDLSKQLLKFEIVNPYRVKLRLNSISAEVFCSDHDVFLGFANETGSIDIRAKSSAIISLLLTFTSEGQTHILTNHLGKDIYVDLRGLALDIQGIKILYKEDIRVGPISIPTR